VTAAEITQQNSINPYAAGLKDVRPNTGLFA